MTRVAFRLAALLGLSLALAVLIACERGGSNGASPNDRDAAPAPTAPRPAEVSPATTVPPLSPPVFTLWVRAGTPDGGDGSSARPFRTINQALAVADAGDAVSVGPGVYAEEVRSVRAGRAGAPIRLVASDAEVRGAAGGRLVELAHDHLTLEAFRLTGADVLVWVQSATGVRIVGNTFSGASGECVRLKYFARGNEVAHNRIAGCGREHFDLDDDRKNGEGIYIGTAPEQRDRNPTDEVDDSGGNWVHDNVIEVPGECIDVKEGSQSNLVESNDCRGSLDPDGAGLSSRGLGTVFRANRSTGNAGAGIRLGGDEEGDGINSVVVDNVFVDNRGYGVKVLRTPQETVCGNTVRNNGDGPVTKGGPNPTAPCR